MKTRKVGLPKGGSTGQVLTKTSGTDYDTEWAAGGGGGGSGTVNSGTQYRIAYYATTGTAVSEASAITASRALKSDTNGVPTHFDTTTEPSLTELSYVKGVTSSIQTQINAKGSGTVTSVAALTLGTSGTDLSSTVANSTTTPVITLNVPTASASNRGALSSTDWSTFNGKQATLVSGTNIKTINGNSVLGSGNLVITATPLPNDFDFNYFNYEFTEPIAYNLYINEMELGSFTSPSVFNVELGTF